MPYQKTTWVEGQTPLGPTNMNKIEQGIETAQSIAEAAQAAAGAAQSAADAAQADADAANTAIAAHIADATAAHAASAISYAGGTGMSATNVEAAIDELATEKAGKADANTWTQRQTFAAGIQDGDTNQDVSLINSIQHQVHTRSTMLTYTNGRLARVEEKDGSTVVKTTTLTYDGNGRLTSVSETAGGVTKTTTLNYDGSGNLSSVTRA